MPDAPRCETCDRPLRDPTTDRLPTGAEFTAYCWSASDLGRCGGLPVDWRSRALATKRERNAAEHALAESEGRAWIGREPDRTPAVDEKIREREEESMDNGRRRSTRHIWSETDEAALRDAVEVVFRSELPEGVERRLSGWAAVAGRLLIDLAVTPDACRTRWGVLLERERAEARRIEDARPAAEARSEEAAAERAAREDERTPEPWAFAAEEPRAVVEPDAWEALRLRIEEYETSKTAGVGVTLTGIHDALQELRGIEARIVERVLNGVVEQVCTALEEIKRDVAGLLAEWRGGGR